MIFKQQMRKADLLTITPKGWLQAAYNGALYQEKVEKFRGLNCAVNATKFFEALMILDQDFRISTALGELILVDSKIEYRLPMENPDEFANINMEQTFKPINIKALRSLSKFVTADYPGIFFKEGFAEVIHSAMIVRTKIPFEFRRVYSAVDLPPSSVATYTTTNSGLWIKYHTNARMLVGRLDLEPADTDSYFMENIPYLPIPQKVKLYWHRCKEALFVKEGLLLDNHILIDDIRGIGKYDGALLGKVIRNCTHWAMDSELMCFKNENIIGVLENVEYS